MASAGTVTVDFAAETAKFTAELKKVRGELNALQKQGQAVAKGFQTAGKLIATSIAGVTIGAAIRAVIRATTEAEESSARLGNALKASGAAATLTLDQLKNYASGLQRTTTFTDEAIQEVESLLLSFRGLSGETILKATSAVADLSARMGIDLKSAALQVGKALSDPEKGLSALARSGVRFSEAQQQTIKRLAETGNLAKAQGLILAELETRFGGAARAARDTFGGALTGVSNAFGDLLEAKGGMPGATAALNELAETLSDPKIKQGIDSLISGVSVLLELSARAVAQLPKLSSAIAISGLFGGTTPFADATAALEKELVLEKARFEALKSNFPLMKEQIANEQAYIETLKQRIAITKELAAAQVAREITPVTVSVSRVAVAPEFNFEARQNVLEARQKALTASIQTMAGALEAFDAAQTAIEKKRFASLDKFKTLNDALMEERLRQHIDGLNREVDATIAAEQRKFDATAEFEKQKESLQKGAFAAGVGLLQALSVRSKTAAKALILVNRGVAIAQVVQNTIAAASKALAIYGPTPAGYAAAASAKAWGAVQIGLLAATAGLEIGNVNSGNAGGIGGSNLGTPANPLPVTEQPVGAQQRPITQFYINGPITGNIQWLIDTIKEQIDSDVVIIPSGSRQAAEIRGD